MVVTKSNVVTVETGPGEGKFPRPIRDWLAQFLERFRGE